MDDHATPRPAGTATPVPGPLAATMLRVQEQLRSGAAPTFESLLAFGEPVVR